MNAFLFLLGGIGAKKPAAQLGQCSTQLGQTLDVCPLRASVGKPE